MTKTMILDRPIETQQEQDAEQPAGLIVALRTTGSRYWMEVTREGRLPNREVDLALGEWMKVRDALGYVLTWRWGVHEVWRKDGHTYTEAS